MAETEKKPVIDRKRSPGFPTLSLEDAIEKVSILYKLDKGAATSPEVIATHWKTKTNSSTFMQDLASLKRYGLLVAAAGAWKVSHDAIDILLLEDADPSRLSRIKAVALAPKIHKELWDEYGVTLPSDVTLRHKLVREKGFQLNSAGDLITQYKKTLAFAKLSNDDKISNKEEEKVAKNGDQGIAAKAMIETGEFVQWDSLGVAQFVEPRQVTGKSADGQWLFVEGSSTGIPMSQCKKCEVDAGKSDRMPTETISSVNLRPPPNPNFFPSKPPTQAKEYSLTTDTGDVVVRWPAVLTNEDFQTVEMWLESVKLKIKRSVKGDEDSPRN